MKRGKRILFGCFCACWFDSSASAAETLDSLIAGAKKESEITFIAGAQTFGGQKTSESARSGVQQEVRAQRQNSFFCRAGDERDGRASDHRAEKRRQGFERSLSRLAIASVPAAQRKGVGEGQLFGHLSLDHQRDGNLS